MSRMSINMVGAAEMRERLAGMGAQASTVLEPALLVAAALIVNDAKTIAAKRSGTLARSITAVTTENTGTSVRVEVGPQVNYGVYVEYGTGIYAQGGGGRQTPWVYKGADGRFYRTRGMRAQPFMRPAFAMNQARAQVEFRRALSRLLTP